MTILIVDDNEPNLYQLQVLLSGSGYQVLTAVNGADALTTARQNPPDVVISDILMPVMDGFTLCREWKKDERLRQIPFVFYTATYTDERDREFALSLGAEQFLVKPEEPEVFIRIIREVTQQLQRPPASPAADTPARIQVEEPPKEESRYLTQYNEVLIRKLEAKMQQLEQANRQLERDITERKKAEESRSYLASIVESSNDAIIGKSLDGVIVSWNAAAERVYGHSAAEIIGHSISAIVPPNRLDEMPQIIEKVKRGERIDRFETVRVKNDGELVDVSLTVSPIRDAAGRIIGASTVARDITERKRAEAALRESEQLYRSVVNSVAEGILLQDRAGRIVASNRSSERILGRTAEGLKGQIAPDPSLQAIHEDGSPLPEGDLPHMITLRTGKPQSNVRIGFPRPDGTLVWVLANAEPIFHAAKSTPYAVVTSFADITEQKQAEDALIEEKHLLHTLMDNLPDSVYFKDRESRFTRINKAHAKLFGLRDPSHGVGRTDFDFFTVEHAQEAYNDEREIIRTGQPVVDKEEKETWPDGHVTWVSTTKMPLRDANGNIIGTFGVSRDITDRMRAEEALRESEEKYRSLVSNIPDVAWTMDAEFRFVFISKKMERVSGFSPDEIYRQGIHLYLNSLHPDDVHKVTQGLQALFAEGRPFDVECRAKRKDGEWIWIHDRALATYEREGMRYADGLLSDITERKRAEAEHVRLVTAIEQSAEGVVITSTTGDIEYVNPAFSRITGYSREEALGQNPRILKSGKQDPALYQQLWATILNGQTWHGELINRRKDGSLYTEQMNITPVRDELGEVAHFIATKLDVSARKQLEQQFFQAQKMEAVGRLAGGVAHDFNNLLTIINGFAALLSEQTSAEDPRRGHLKEILMAGERAASLTRQLLAFSRRQVMEPRVLDLSSVLAEIEKMLRHLMGEDVELVTTLRPGLGRVKVDAGQIEQVIMNLAVNARDAMPKGGKLLIETSNVEVDEDYTRSHSNMISGKYVMMAVSDTGSGMNLDTQAHIFEPFFTTKEEGRGTGLGLATVYGIVKQSGGFIWVDSEPGRGSTFKIYFPQVEEVVPTTESTEIRTMQANGSETILVVEDEAGVRSMVCEALMSHGYKVLEATGATQALMISRQHKDPIHLLLTDVVLPGTDGKRLALRLSALHSETKVLYMSGYTDDAIVRHGIMEGSMPFLQKPFGPNALLVKVREVLEMKSGTQQ
jgi:PAS domain S-box-containing protein